MTLTQMTVFIENDAWYNDAYVEPSSYEIRLSLRHS